MSKSGGNAEVVAKRGDVILQSGQDGVGEGVRKILVSSVVLGLASPVFAAMFDGRFSEGQNLSPASPRTVPLPDDDPESITMICKIAHMQTSELPLKLAATVLSKIALLCNKYDCANVVRSWAIIWIGALLEDFEAADFEKMLLATHLLELPREFFRVSQRLVRDPTAILSVTKATDGHEFLPLEVFEYLLLRQISYQRRITTAFASIVTGLEFCAASKQALSTFIFGLRRNDLWPVNQCSVLIIKSKLRTVPELPPLFASCTTPNCACKSLARYTKATLIAELDKIYDAVDGLCLDCVRQKVLGEQKRECRVPHAMREATVYP
ncbi:uncharacterized protein J4E92_006292 [Alternaria infectoria]|uniref:uncharacterized protein n=1 Tax=Alternaria infectoria TaxID=45303 RepID=UPI0022202F84|nr:uncharacterized protein J4E92_006292 [Alternaria infectoria]KAI4708106.1 hypothetical protein J4E89_007226 [Alternaria sp. Ai002NY15]KAI4927127.1 hypothetical protein J4E92_006292 [Alternaria infectoria]